MQTRIPLCEAHQSYHSQRPRWMRSRCLQSRGWAAERFWQCWAFAIYPPCRQGKAGIWSFSGPEWRFLWSSEPKLLSKLIVILTQHLWFSSQMPQNAQQSPRTFPTLWVQAAVRAHSGKEDVEGRCGHPVHTTGHGMDVANPSPQPTMNWNQVWRSCFERLKHLLLAGNRQ